MVAAPPSHLTISSLGLQRNDRWLFRNLSWEVPRGKVVAVVGASGAGKSSLLACLSGLLTPSEGQLSYCCKAGCPHEPKSYQSRIGIVFQHFALSLNSTLLRNVLCGRLGRYPWWKTLLHFPRGDKEEAYRLLVDLGLGTYVHRRAAEVSGGEQQRTALLRAVFQEPEIILADEPVSQLDAYLAGRVLGLLRSLAHEHQRTIICVLHDAALVERFADFALSLNPLDPEGWKIRALHG
ncbi:MAG TPA: ATP-binding cassette domain-containing protein [Chthoniobacteraceae bacterium]|jgi:phosphonate transport system ATP-binding protein